MLDFYLLDDSNEFLGHLSMQDAKWLVKMNLINGEQLPFDDFEWTPEQINELYLYYKAQLKRLKQIAGFESSSLKIYGRVLEIAKDRGCGIRAVSD